MKRKQYTLYEVAYRLSKTVAPMDNNDLYEYAYSLRAEGNDRLVYSDKYIKPPYKKVFNAMYYIMQIGEEI